jgi:hypothetical protein
MAASRLKIREWFQEGKINGATHMIVVCDTYDYEDFPVYVMPGTDVKGAVEDERKKAMQNVMEVYDLSMSEDEQVDKTGRVFNF